MRWEEPMIFALRELWPSGKSCSEIARELGRRFHITVTKSMVCGKAHRTPGLDVMPSPIVRTRKIDDPKLRKIRQLQTAGHTQRKIAEIMEVSRDMIARAAPVANPPLFTLAPAPIPATNVVAFPSVRCCQFPLWGHKERPKFGRDGMPLFCNASTLAGPYCAKHKRKVYRQWDEVA